MGEGHTYVVWGNIFSNAVLIIMLGFMISRWMKGIEGKIMAFCKETGDANKCILGKIDQLQKDMAGKSTAAEHKEVQIELGQYGDRILKLELQVKVIEDKK